MRNDGSVSSHLGHSDECCARIPKRMRSDPDLERRIEEREERKRKHEAKRVGAHYVPRAEEQIDHQEADEEGEEKSTLKRDRNKEEEQEGRKRVRVDMVTETAGPHPTDDAMPEGTIQEDEGPPLSSSSSASSSDSDSSKDGDEAQTEILAVLADLVGRKYDVVEMFSLPRIIEENPFRQA